MSQAEVPGQFGRYKIQSLLGKGAQGQVYLAHDPNLDRKVAIKSLIVREQEKEKFIDQFMTEARIVSMLQHPNIVTLYDAGNHNGEPGFRICKR